ncbi:hypothetical protein PCANC_23510 [Puccinia coronata f. sp. avenae]|uniref:Uncharacterized protein n=1 Tax=Puccinia coronata f. sp. avenae TaxID=200324 RepID=A0A2N5TPR4_9BASI|nr:hypothetical protein PCANC_23510 [Puccinia coronata f. sp. avenae]
MAFPPATIVTPLDHYPRQAVTSSGEKEDAIAELCKFIQVKPRHRPGSDSDRTSSSLPLARPQKVSATPAKSDLLLLCFIQSSTFSPHRPHHRSIFCLAAAVEHPVDTSESACTTHSLLLAPNWLTLTRGTTNDQALVARPATASACQ